MSYLKDIKPEKPVYPGFVYKLPLKKKIFPLHSILFINTALFPETSTIGHLEWNHSLLMEKQINNIFTQLMYFPRSHYTGKLLKIFCLTDHIITWTISYSE